MLDWIVRVVSQLSGTMAGWIIAPDAHRFGLAQIAFAILLVTSVVVLAAVLPLTWSRKRPQKHDP
ncbi:hypothetical protein [Bosea sp. CRIB-10]|uniref:hypothetical protein n=1 Tax=Bosea sp. CRIB-10 TaxID=378404 RepID=UPI000B86E655|nr:hypothetical protein [Bosea sp. CRIB-10]